MILDLLDLTRIESGQKKRELAEVDVRQVAQTAIETIAAEAVTRNVTVELHADGPVTMQADLGEIEIILNNLVSNAVKYNRPGGRVDVTIGSDDEKMTITVVDTGIGMSKEETERLFGDFVRIKNEKTRDILGSGLGLSIVSKLAQLYDGQASVASAVGIGSTFTVVLRRNAQAGSENEQVRNNPLVAGE